MRVIDLFSGTGSATQAFTDEGHQVFRVELDPSFPADLYADVSRLSKEDVGEADFVWASPPCTGFSVGGLRAHWHAVTSCRRCEGILVRQGGGVWEHIVDTNCHPSPYEPLRYMPKSETARTGLSLLNHTLRLIHEIKPKWWVIENPRGMMRKMSELQGVEIKTITHCQYGDPRRMKPTDLFGVFPKSFVARSCKNGDSCHVSAPRGSLTGTQGLDRVESAKLPYQLGKELVYSISRER